MKRREISLYLAVVATLAGGCGDDEPHVDNFPIVFSRDQGGVLLPVSEGADGQVVTAVVDTLSPVTVVDPFEAGVAQPAISRRSTTLMLHSAAALPGGDPIARVLLSAVDVLALHPCGEMSTSACEIGHDAEVAQVGALLGTDTLSRFAVRLNFAASAMTLFPDMAGSDVDRSRSCDAVFGTPFYGGGTLLVGGAELSFDGRRLAIEACLGHTPLAANQVERGVAAMFVVSTAIGPTLLSNASYLRYRAFDPLAPDLATAPSRTVHLPSGPVSGTVASIDRLALVAEASSDRGPCRELYANYLLAEDGCTTGADGGDCPCSNEATFCRAGAAVELSNDTATRIEVVVIDDDEPLLQGIRDELRPRLPEVDGIIGTDALSVLELDLDYPNSRVLARCTGLDCRVRPAFSARSHLTDVAACTATNSPVLD